MLGPQDCVISRLGKARLESPLPDDTRVDEDYTLVHDQLSTLLAAGGDVTQWPAFECAGPRHRLYFDPATVRAGIVTCGGLCPGLNDVIRALVMVLYHRYGVRKVDGYRYGYEGLNPRCGHDVVPLWPSVVEDIHKDGGTILGSSRGPQDPAVMVDFLMHRGVNVLFVIGGDGTLRGATDISRTARQRGHELAVIGIPKTIDNDIRFIDSSFGFVTAVSAAVDAIASAHIEAKASHNGIGLVQLMGRHCGFIAAAAAMASNDVNYVLVPEVPFPVEGRDGLLASLEKRLAGRHHAVIVVAEGAGQQYCAIDGRDASGNKRLGEIGVWLRERVQRHFDVIGVSTSVRYINPSYMIRSLPASASDSVYCYRLAAYAVHAAMSGRTDMIVGRYHGRYVHIPIPLAIAERKRMDPAGADWRAVLEATGQPVWRQPQPAGV
jgi:6-phosphofructokinase 1